MTGSFSGAVKLTYLIWLWKCPSHASSKRWKSEEMPRIPSGHRHDNNTEDSFLGLTGGLLILLVTSSVLFLGALCKYLRKLCRKLKGKELWKRGSKKRKSKRGEKSKRSSSVRRSSSRASRTKEGLIAVSPEFSIPSSRSTVTQQPAPDLSQGRTGRSNEEKRLS